ncbi:MAG: hypothetical protein HQ546_08640 [Planctomycetes bacterium]|nr:hypothetical protein [Planctomycetota bacterium]
MKKLIALLLACIVLGLTGCATMTETPSERNSRILHNWRIQSRQLVEDVDTALLLDKPSSLTPYHIRTGSAY